jgi:hypothetical protein
MLRGGGSHKSCAGTESYLPAWNTEYQPNVNLLLRVPIHKEGAFVLEV